MLKSLLLQAIFLLFLTTTLASSNFKVDPNTQFFLDQYGRTTIFHGVNAIYKLNPAYPPILDRFDPALSLAPVDFENLRSWGFNIIRLYVAWEATEPVRGQYNQTYLDMVMNITKTAAKYNITILLDAHQDVVNRKLCGEGWPDWAVNRTDFPAPVDAKIRFDDQGHAIISDCLKIDFGKYYKSHDVRNAFKALYDNKDDIAESFANFWKTVANYFKDQPNVLGYELINEPNTFEDSLTKNHDKLYLQPLYKRIHDKIRQVDNNSIIFFENMLSDTVSVGFTEGPGGPSYNDKQAFAYHIYCPLHDSSGEPVNPQLCQTADSAEAKIKAGAAKKLGVGAFMTEFGAVGNGTKSIDEINRVISLVDASFHSWAYWQFKYYDDFTTMDQPGSIESFYNVDGSLQRNKVKALARTYVYSVCGVPVSQSFDVPTGRFLYVFKASKKCQGFNTEFFASGEFYYPDGVEWTLVNCEGCTVRQKAGQKNYYEIVLSDKVPEDARITLNIVNGDDRRGNKEILIA